MRREFFDYGGELAIEFFVRFEHLPQSHEGPHDRDVNFDGLFAVQDTRKHRHTLLSERVWQMASSALSRT